MWRGDVNFCFLWDLKVYVKSGKFLGFVFDLLMLMKVKI